MRLPTKILAGLLTATLVFAIGIAGSHRPGAPSPVPASHKPGQPSTKCGHSHRPGFYGCGTGGVASSGGAGGAASGGAGGTASGGAGGTASGGAGGGSSSITIVHNTSRTTCTAPCGVFFDVTNSTGLAYPTTRRPGGDAVRASWYWDFDSTGVTSGGEPHRHGISAHPFHMYETAGTYSACVGVIDGAGNVAGPSCQTITVSSNTWTDYYASAAGSGTACTSGAPCSATTALTHFGANHRILFKRGDTFSFGSTPISINSITGPMVLGAWSTGAAPLLTFTATTPIDLGSSTDIVFTDLRVTATGIGGPFPNGYQLTGSFQDIYVLRGETSGSATECGTELFTTDYTGSNTAVVDSNFHTFCGYFWYATAPVRAAIVGTSVSDEHGQDHAFRWQSCSETTATSGVCSANRKGFALYVDGNTIDCGADTFDCGTFRGSFSYGAMVNNFVSNTISQGPQNGTVYEYGQDVLFENNEMVPTTGISTGNCETYAGRHIVARNNRCYNATTFADIPATTQMTAGWVDEIYLFNNTMDYPTTCTTSGSSFLTWENGTPTDLQIKNNAHLIRCANIHQFGTQTFLGGIANGGPVAEDYNITYAPGDSANWIPPSGAHDLNSDPGFASETPGAGTFLRLNSLSSNAADHGTTVGAFRDGDSIIRPQSTAFDMGAFEFH